MLRTQCVHRLLAQAPLAVLEGFGEVVGLIIGILVFKYVIIPVEAHPPFEFPFGTAYLTTKPSYTSHMAFILLVVSLAAAFIPVWRVMRIKNLDAILGINYGLNPVSSLPWRHE
jgi:ABC-type lipoprotein release transport system permease subunit